MLIVVVATFFHRCPCCLCSGWHLEKKKSRKKSFFARAASTQHIHVRTLSHLHACDSPRRVKYDIRPWQTPAAQCSGAGHRDVHQKEKYKKKPLQKSNKYAKYNSAKKSTHYTCLPASLLAVWTIAVVAVTCAISIYTCTVHTHIHIPTSNNVIRTYLWRLYVWAAVAVTYSLRCATCGPPLEIWARTKRASQKRASCCLKSNWTTRTLDDDVSDKLLIP